MTTDWQALCRLGIEYLAGLYGILLEIYTVLLQIFPLILLNRFYGI